MNSRKPITSKTSPFSRSSSSQQSQTRYNFLSSTTFRTKITLLSTSWAFHFHSICSSLPFRLFIVVYHSLLATLSQKSKVSADLLIALAFSLVRSVQRRTRIRKDHARCCPKAHPFGGMQKIMFKRTFPCPTQKPHRKTPERRTGPRQQARKSTRRLCTSLLREVGGG